jgi:hypothetical protein
MSEQRGIGGKVGKREQGRAGHGAAGPEMSRVRIEPEHGLAGTHRDDRNIPGSVDLWKLRAPQCRHVCGCHDGFKGHACSGARAALLACLVAGGQWRTNSPDQNIEGPVSISLMSPIILI